MAALVSILIPCYNAEKWVATTLESALAQSWPAKEIILVDDGSTDASFAVAQRYAAPNVKVLRQANGGASAARNRALREAQGEFIQYLDADDLLSPTKIEAQVLLLQHNPAKMLALCGTTHFWDGQPIDEGIYHDGLPFYADSDDPIEWLIRLLGGDGPAAMVHPSAWLTPRSLIEAAGNWNEDLSVDDDGEYFARVILKSKGIRRAPDVASYYRKFRSGGSLSHARSEAQHWSGLNATRLKAKHLLPLTTDPRAKVAIANGYMSLAVGAYPDYPQVTEAALADLRALGVRVKPPRFGTWKSQLVSQLLGWKTARRISARARPKPSGLSRAPSMR